MIAALLLACDAREPATPGETGEPSDPVAAWEAEQGLALVRVRAGAFLMGSPADEVGRQIPEGIPGSEYPDREAQHEVTLTRDFLVAAHEVSRGLFADWMGFDPSASTACTEADCPADTVTWSAAAAFANALSEGAGLEPCYTCSSEGTAWACEGPADPYACAGYRLPTEAEWEYAARAGETASFPGGGNLVSEADIEDCSSDYLLDNGVALVTVGWYCANAGGRAHPGGSFVNAWGLYDVLGNIHEWTNDRYDPTWYQQAAASGEDPVGPAVGEERVRRGGAFGFEPRRLRLAYRGFHAGDDPTEEVGFRFARTAP
ncbi:MAG: formylglycine-generating enzyme family protein [Myxococcota bacterium]